jgi:hypothetical protein
MLLLANLILKLYHSYMIHTMYNSQSHPSVRTKRTGKLLPLRLSDSSSVYTRIERDTQEETNDRRLMNGCTTVIASKALTAFSQK